MWLRDAEDCADAKGPVKVLSRPRIIFVSAKILVMHYLRRKSGGSETGKRCEKDDAVLEQLRYLQDLQMKMSSHST